MQALSYYSRFIVLCVIVTALCANVLTAQMPTDSVFADPQMPVTSPTFLPYNPVEQNTAPQPENETTPLAPTRQSGELYLSSVPNGQRSGMFQKANFNVLWVPKNGGNKALGMTELELAATFALPMPTPESPLIFTPCFNTTFFDGKYFNETLFKTGVDIRWLRPISPKKLTADLGVGVFYTGDFRAAGRDAIRIPAHAALIWGCNPRVKVIAGVAYLDRNDSYNVLPVAGIIWTPQENLSVELVFPRLRIAERVNWFGTGDNAAKSDWFYGAFEFAGGSWGYEVADGIDNRIEYEDMRLLFGLERRTVGGFTLGLETGYMFDRQLEGFGGKSHAADSVFIRLRTAY
ncbi:hypothetical protein FACS1894170_00830 [Planctomycetales bacterium]|nr:hypothetical protein FACS1894170_00830 [Planctomycetales bacterium]